MCMLFSPCVVLRLFVRLRPYKRSVEVCVAVYVFRSIVRHLMVCGFAHRFPYAPHALMDIYLMANVSLRGCPGTDV